MNKLKQMNRLKRFFSVTLLTTFFILFIDNAIAQTNYIEKQSIVAWANATISTRNIQKVLSGVNDNEMFREYGSTLEVFFDVSAGGEYIYGKDILFNVLIRFHLTAKDKNGLVVEGCFDKSEYMVELDNDQPKYILKRELPENVQTVELTITSVTEDPGNPATLDAKSMMSFTSKYGYRAGDMMPSDLSVQSNGSLHTFSWFHLQPGGFLYNSYQIQILRLYNTNPAILSNTQISTNVNWSKSFTIEVPANPMQSNQSYSLKIAEGSGFYVWRVRPIGTYYDGGVGNSLNWGAWSVSPIDNEQVSFETNENLPVPYFFYSDPEEDMNKIYSRIFAEDYKMKESVVYANGLLQTYQSQVYIPSNNTTVISGSVYDQSGRSKLNTVPIPFENQYLGFQTNFLRNSDGLLYSMNDIDANSGIPEPVKQDDPNLDYYNNNDENIANVGGHPFQSTLFYNDPMGRVKEEGGVGETFNLENPDSHTVKHYYSVPSEDELIRLFGDEAPSNESVIKMTTIDQNNIATVTYNSLQGKVLATCLSFTESNTMNEVDGYSPVPFQVNDKVLKNIQSGNDIISTKRLAFLQETPVTFYYKLTDQSNFGTDPCLDLYCTYDLKISIFNAETGELIAQSVSTDESPHRINLSGGSNYYFDHAYLNIQYLADQTTVESLAPGTYIITKTLSPVSASLDDNLANIQSQVYPVTNLIMSWLDKVATGEWEYGEFVDVVLTFKCYLDQNLWTIDNLRNVSGCSPIEPLNFDVFIPEVVRYNEYRESYELNNCLNKPDFICLSTACCQNIEIDISRPYTCQTVESNCQYGPGADMTFENFARDYLGTCSDFVGENFYTNFLLYYMPGWEIPGTFDAMINEMLKETKDGSAPAPDAPNDVYVYTCDQLFSCWRALLAKVKADHEGCGETIDLDEIQLQPFNISSSFDDAHYEENGGTYGDAHDNHFDESLRDAGLNWLIRKYIGMRLSKRIREEQNSQSALFNPEMIQSYERYHIVREFLECTGYHYEKILTPYEAAPDLTSDNNDLIPGFSYTSFLPEGEGTYVKPSVLEELNLPAYAPYEFVTAAIEIDPVSPWNDCFSELYSSYISDGDYLYIPIEGWNDRTVIVFEVDGQGDPVRWKEFFPNIHNPVFAYKYFQYDDAGNRQYTALENQTCFSDPNDCYKVKSYSNGFFISNNILGGPETERCCKDELEGETYGFIDGDFCIDDESGNDYVENFEGYNGGIRCPYTHEAWNAGQRLTFWRMLENYTPMYPINYGDIPEIRNTCADVLAKPAQGWHSVLGNCDSPYDFLSYDERDAFNSGEFPSNWHNWWDNYFDCDLDPIPINPIYNLMGVNDPTTSLLEMSMVDEQNKCIESCEERFESFYQQLRQTFLDSCYTIVSCIDNASPQNYVTEAQILQIAQQLVTDCKQNCTITSFSCDDIEQRSLTTPKYYFKRKASFSVNLGVAGIPSNYEDCLVSQVDKLDLNPNNYDPVNSITTTLNEPAKRYYFDPQATKYTPPGNLSWFEYTLIKQATSWDFDIQLPSFCFNPPLTIGCVDCPTDSKATYVEKSTYETHENVPQPNNNPPVVSPWVKKIVETNTEGN
jgi:hypothetical protein